MSVITMADILIFISIENFSLLCTSVRVQILEILELSPGAKELITWIVDIKPVSYTHLTLPTILRV